MCQSVTRKTFMRKEFPEVKHLILDEVNGFRAEDGDWLEKARRIVRQHEHDRGYLWMFIDNEQINHYFPTGIPSEVARTPLFSLKKVIRTTARIFEYAKAFLSEEAAGAIEMGHDLEGEEPLLQKYPKGHQLVALNDILQSLFQKGYSEGEIAILFEKEGSFRDIERDPSKLNLERIADAENNHSQDVVVTSFRKYSGLDRPVVILVDIRSSVAKAFKCNEDASMYCATTRGMGKLIVLEETPSRKRKRKLS